MKANINSHLACRYCKFYSPEGRRGGECQCLGVPVQGKWAACSAMIPSFSSPLEVLEESVLLETQGVSGVAILSLPSLGLKEKVYPVSA